MTQMAIRTDPPAAAAASAPRRLSVLADVASGLGASATAFPGEAALLLRVALPLASHRQRQAAVAFAVEDLIAEPLEAVHVALGPALGPGEYLVAVVGRSVMTEWAAPARAAGRRLVPDVLALPLPPEGSWSVCEIAGRVLVRRDDGTGFVTRAESFEPLWRAGAAPQIVLFGGRLPEAVPAGATGLLPTGATDAAAGFTLLQGPFARSDAGWRHGARRLALVLALALVAHGAILGAKIHALHGIATTREGALRAELSLRLGELPPAVPLDAALLRALPETAAPGGGFLPLFAAVAAALAPFAGGVAVANLAFGAADGQLAITVEAADLATLQQIESGLAAAGLGVQAGVATTGDGAAEVRFVITPAPA